MLHWHWYISLAAISLRHWLPLLLLSLRWMSHYIDYWCFSADIDIDISDDDILRCHYADIDTIDITPLIISYYAIDAIIADTLFFRYWYYWYYWYFIDYDGHWLLLPHSFDYTLLTLRISLLMFSTLYYWYAISLFDIDDIDADIRYCHYWVFTLHLADCWHYYWLLLILATLLLILRHYFDDVLADLLIAPLIGWHWHYYWLHWLLPHYCLRHIY
jgi:hypothetical protein